MNYFGLGEIKQRQGITATPETKKTLRKKIAEDTREFLKRGGEVIQFGFLMNTKLTRKFN